MDPINFSMVIPKTRKYPYLLITMSLTTLLMQSFVWLIELGILPTSKILAPVYLIIPMILMMVLAYHLIFRKNHQINVNGNTITEINWLRKESCRIQAHEIASVRRNLLREVILLDENGKKLLCVEANMTNFDQFENWLERYIK